MTDLDRDELIAQSWKMHSLVEQAYLDNPAVQGDEAWLNKQRLLLADMALHLLQTSLSTGDVDGELAKPLDKEKLRNNLFSIMTISEQFIPDVGLKEAKEKIYSII
ncbi:hypothetical protein Sps_01491 [Shewanella psychrophila]|uniref:Uncharacterized protein n=1 Tax=Shewanella psychrophila TaxID=225848 RepID=A0A1S6HMA7_9GAMM|nr:hypothetical protein [Shewanella psychrophila]AQS36657.1 hypothetical protein Sps_01491 [Shewanella psychrophila]